jgi:hypothetical protein
VLDCQQLKESIDLDRFHPGQGVSKHFLSTHGHRPQPSSILEEVHPHVEIASDSGDDFPKTIESWVDPGLNTQENLILHGLNSNRGKTIPVVVR